MALLSRIEPSYARSSLAKTLPSEVRQWLKEHDYETVPPHTRLSGSYLRHTAISDIPDVDVLLFRPEVDLDRTPNAVVLELKRVLDTYPNASATTRAQRRSVHLALHDYGLHLDIVPAVACDGLDAPLKVPDRPRQVWIDSDPLGYARSLSALNQSNTERVVPLVKLIKAWRDVHMRTQRPKSYLLEVMVFHAITDERITVHGRGCADNFADLLGYWNGEYRDLVEASTGMPRVFDPQLGHLLTAGWERSHFETFMRRVEEAASLARQALDTDDEKKANEAWSKVFGDFWPSGDEAMSAARAEADTVSLGTTMITATGLVVGGGSAATVPTRRTTYHGHQADSQ